MPPITTVRYFCPSLLSVNVFESPFPHPANQIAATTVAVVSKSLRIMVDPLG
jgi:hypothetical protein